MESRVNPAVKNRNFSAHENCCHFYLGYLVNSFLKLLIDKFLTSTNLFQNFWSSRSIRLIQIVLFLTDSVFYVLFAYFDESMASM